MKKRCEKFQNILRKNLRKESLLNLLGSIIFTQRDAVSISSVNTYKICSICFTPFCNFPLEETEGEAGETGGKIERREGKLKKQVVGDGEIVVNEKVLTRQQAERKPCRGGVAKTEGGAYSRLHRDTV